MYKTRFIMHIWCYQTQLATMERVVHLPFVPFPKMMYQSSSNPGAAVLVDRVVYNEPLTTFDCYSAAELNYRDVANGYAAILDEAGWSVVEAP